MRMSKLNRIVHCAGSMAAESSYAEPDDSPYAVRGTFGHHGMQLSSLSGEFEQKWFDTDPSMDCVDEAKKFWQILNVIFASLGSSGINVQSTCREIKVEQATVLMLTDSPDNKPNPTGYTLTGTADLVAHFPEKRRLVVVDYKFGMGYVPPANMNYQLAGYGLAQFKQYVQEGADIDTVEVHVMSAGMGHTSYQYTSDEMWEMEEFLFNAMKAAHEPMSKQQTGIHCKYCKAFLTGSCLPSQALPDYLIDRAKSTPFTADTAADIHNHKEVIKDALNMAEEKLRRALEAGIPVEGWRITNPMKIRKVVDPVAFIQSCQQHGVTVPTEPKIRWTDVEKQIQVRKALTKDEAKDYIDKNIQGHDILLGKPALRRTT